MKTEMAFAISVCSIRIIPHVLIPLIHNALGICTAGIRVKVYYGEDVTKDQRRG